MYTPEKSLPPPPTALKPRNESLGSTLPTYRSRPRGGSASSSGFSFSNAKNMFENLNKPEVRNGIVNLAKNPTVQKTAVSAAKNETVRNVAISAAHDPATRQAAISAAQNPTTRNNILSMAKQFENKPIMQIHPTNTTTANTNNFTTSNSSVNTTWGGSGYSSNNTSSTMNFYGNSFSPPPPAPRPSSSESSSLYPNLSSIDPFDHPPQLPSRQHPIQPRQSHQQQPIDPYPLKPPPVTSKPSFGYRPKSTDPDNTPSWNRTSWNSNVKAFDSLGSGSLQPDWNMDYGKKKPAPARPPPPKLGSRSMTNLASLSPSPDPHMNEPHAIVKYPYKRAHPDELNCEPNDIVLLKREVDDQWIFATNTRTGESGIVPMPFLLIKIPLVPTAKGSYGGGGMPISMSDYTGFSSSSQSSKNMARALYDYETGVDGDLRFKCGDFINVIERISEEWLRGEVHGKWGIFPVNYVQIDDLYSIPMEQKSISTSTLTGTFEVPKVTVTAIYDYDSGVSDDLKFKAGDSIEVVKYVSDEWIMGQLYGKSGLVPLTFVQQN